MPAFAGMTICRVSRVIQRSQSIYKKNGLSEAVFTRSANILAKALEGGKQLTRSEIYNILVSKGVATKGVRGVLILGELAMEGLICFGLKKGKQQTFTLLDEWVTEFNDYEKDEALSILAKRFFTSHGPASLNDFVWWSGILVEDAKKALDSIKSELVEETIDGKVYYMPKTKKIKEAESAHLLQAYDEFTIAYRNNPEIIIDPKYVTQFAVANGFTWPFVINGKIAGTWKKTIKPDKVVVHTKPFEKLSDSDRSLLVNAAQDYAKFVGLELIFI